MDVYSPTILLVEDNQLLRWWMTSSLEHEGCRVVAPKTAEEAIATASQVPVDVLITDCRLAEGHDGFEILARVREHNHQTLAILISAEDCEELYPRARANGFDLVIEKPFPVAEIVGAVQRLIVAVRRAEAVS